MRDDTNVSVIIIYSFVFVFIVFLFLQQGNFIAKTPATGYAFLDTNVFQNLNSLSLATLIIIAAILILLIIGALILHKKIKSRKKSIENPQQSDQKSLADLNKEFNNPKTPEKQDSNLLDSEMNKLFMEEIPAPAKETEVKPEVKVEEVKFNLADLKNLIISLTKKNYTKESIVKYLTKKGYSLIQIKEAVRSINEDSLGLYIKNALSQGFNRNEIMRSLMQSGWSKEDILKRLS